MFNGVKKHHFWHQNGVKWRQWCQKHHLSWCLWCQMMSNNVKMCCQWWQKWCQMMSKIRFNGVKKHHFWHLWHQNGVKWWQKMMSMMSKAPFDIIWCQRCQKKWCLWCQMMSKSTIFWHHFFIFDIIDIEKTPLMSKKHHWCQKMVSKSTIDVKNGVKKHHWCQKIMSKNTIDVKKMMSMMSKSTIFDINGAFWHHFLTPMVLFDTIFWHQWCFFDIIDIIFVDNNGAFFTPLVLFDTIDVNKMMLMVSVDRKTRVLGHQIEEEIGTSQKGVPWLVSANQKSVYKRSHDC